MKLILIAFILTLFGLSLYGQSGEFKKYSYDNNFANKLHFSFDLPNTWTVIPDDDDTGFLATCKPTTKEEIDTYDYCFEGIVFRIDYFRGDLDSALQQDGMYSKIGESYYTSDRVSDSVKTEKLKGSNWNGLYHLSTCGIYCKDNGFHATAGECEFVYFSDGKQTICIITNGKQFDEFVLKRIVNSFKFD